MVLIVFRFGYESLHFFCLLFKVKSPFNSWPSYRVLNITNDEYKNIMTSRSLHLLQWVQQTTPVTSFVAIPGDASFRHYYRIISGDKTFIAVDAPPEHENNIAFVAISRSWSILGLHVPTILAVDFEQGFLLLNDLGNKQLLQVLNDSNVHAYYGIALESLATLQSCESIEGWQLPAFNEDLLLEELSRFHHWYLASHLGMQISHQEQNLLHETYQLLIKSAVEQPKVCVHRDYHSRNLMVLEGNELGILDFQDAVIGPITYDLVSLVRDCYIDWPTQQVYAWVRQFWLQSNVRTNETEFIRWFDLMGMQRHLKVLGIFARLYRRDQKSLYLQEIPRILNYILFVCERYPECKAFAHFLHTRVLPYESHDISRRAGIASSTLDGRHT